MFKTQSEKEKVVVSDGKIKKQTNRERIVGALFGIPGKVVWEPAWKGLRQAWRLTRRLHTERM